MYWGKVGFSQRNVGQLLAGDLRCSDEDLGVGLDGCGREGRRLRVDLAGIRSIWALSGLQIVFECIRSAGSGLRA